MSTSNQSSGSAGSKLGMFQLPDGKNMLFTFCLVSSLFLLWGVCNGMIDVMDKHFQNELNLTKAQSANVQFAHYLGYFLMALPAGWLARRWGWKGGIIAGLLLVAVGGFWFLPATSIQAAAHAGNVSANMAFGAYLLGVGKAASSPVCCWLRSAVFGFCRPRASRRRRTREMFRQTWRSARICLAFVRLPPV